MTASGQWRITIDTPMGPKTGVLDLAVSGTALTGSMTDGEHRVVLGDGSAQGNTLTWSAKISKPMRMTFKFTATVEADRISGEAKYLLGRAAFSGTRIV